jgi:protein SCO1/2|tara:strand:+ start:847 stop:1455 length:609 start_codon:yes stop_codon:yes gene_type:complete
MRLNKGAENILKRKKKDSVYWGGFIIIGLFIGAFLIFRDSQRGFGTITFGMVPEFEFTDQLGQPFSKDDLSNKVWVGSFISADCTENQSCQNILKMTASIYQQVKNEQGIQMVSISVDPINTQSKLFQIIENQSNTHPDGWKFLSGDDDIIRSFAYICLRDNLTKFDTRFFLVDQNGTIRGYYQSDNLNEVKRLVKDIQKLV